MPSCAAGGGIIADGSFVDGVPPFGLLASGGAPALPPLAAGLVGVAGMLGVAGILGMPFAGGPAAGVAGVFIAELIGAAAPAVAVAEGGCAVLAFGVEAAGSPALGAVAGSPPQLMAASVRAWSEIVSHRLSMVRLTSRGFDTPPCSCDAQGCGARSWVLFSWP